LAFESKSSPSPQEIGLESDLSPSPGLESYNSGLGLGLVFGSLVFGKLSQP